MSRTFNRRGMIMVWEMATHALYSRQQSRYANVLIGSTNYLAKVNGRNVKDITATLTPKFIFDLEDQKARHPQICSLPRLCVAVMALGVPVVGMEYWPFLIV